MALVPMPMPAKPMSDSAGQGEKKTTMVEAKSSASSTRATPAGE